MHFPHQFFGKKLFSIRIKGIPHHRKCRALRLCFTPLGKVPF
jgi:hypothetical protein